MSKLVKLLAVLAGGIGWPLVLSAQDSCDLLYLANVNGTLENCQCGREPLGGIDRLVSVIEQYRARYPQLLVINGGDYFNSYSFMALDTVLLNTLPLAGFDIFVPGDQEFVEGESFYTRICAGLKKSPVLSNESPAPHRIFTFACNHRYLNVYAYLSPAAFSYIYQPENLILQPAQIDFSRAGKKAFNLVVCHGYLDEARELARRNPAIDLILLAHDQYADADTIGSTTLIGAGRDAEFVVEVHVEKAGSRWKIDHRKIKLNDSIPVNESMLSLINAFKEKSKSGKQ